VAAVLDLDVSVDAERAVLGSCLLDNRALYLVQLRDTDFTRHDHRAIYGAMWALSESGKPFDIVTLAETMQARGDFEAGTFEYLGRLVRETPTAKNATHYADLVRTRARQREAHRILTDGARKVAEQGASAVGQVQADLERVMTVESDDVLDFGQVMTQAEEQAKALRTMEAPIKANLPSFDARVPIFGKCFVVVAARPSVGKTAFVTQMAKTAAVGEWPGACIHLEMTKRQMGCRVIANHFGLNVSRLLKGDDYEWDLYRSRRMDEPGEFRKLPLYSDFSSFTLDAVMSRIVELHRRHGIQWAVVDHLHKFSLPGKQRPDLEYAHISVSLDRLSKRLNIPILLVAQLNRDIEKSERQPRLSDLRECGSLEQDADVVVFLHGDRDTDEMGNRAVELIVEKNRDGVVSSLGKFRFNGPSQRFEELKL
jgi:replicative DNA helicase